LLTDVAVPGHGRLTGTVATTAATTASLALRRSRHRREGV